MVGGRVGLALTGSMTFIWMDSALLLSLGSECRTHHLPRSRRGHQPTLTAPYAPTQHAQPHALSFALALQGAPGKAALEHAPCAPPPPGPSARNACAFGNL